MLKADQYGISLAMFYDRHDSRDVAVLMAFDNLKDSDYREKIEYSLMTDEEKLAQQKKAFEVS